MAIGHIVTLGFGNGTFAGTVGNVVTLGYTSGTTTPLTADIGFRLEKVGPQFKPQKVGPQFKFQKVGPQFKDPRDG